MVHSEKFNAGFTYDELQKVADSVRINVLRKNKNYNALLSSIHDPLHDYIDHQYGGLINLVPYIILDKYSPKLEGRLESIISSDPDIGGWLSEPKNAISYAHRLRN